MDELSRKHFEAIVAQETAPNSPATKALVEEFNNSLDNWLLNLAPEDIRETLRERFKK
jgi:hypothetical protein